MFGDRYVLTEFHGEEYITDTTEMPKMLEEYDVEEVKEHHVCNALTRSETCMIFNEYEIKIELLKMNIKMMEKTNPFQNEIVERLEERLRYDRNYLVKFITNNYEVYTFDMREWTCCYDTNFLTFISDKWDDLTIVNLDNLASISITPIPPVPKVPKEDLEYGD